MDDNIRTELFLLVYGWWFAATFAGIVACYFQWGLWWGSAIMVVYTIYVVLDLKGVYPRIRRNRLLVEAANLIVEKLRRTGHGFRNFRNYRLRLLLNHGVKWQTQPTTKIRGRRPPKIA